MQVKCIDTVYHEGKYCTEYYDITKDKIYTGTYHDSVTYAVFNDNGKEVLYPKKLFEISHPIGVTKDRDKGKKFDGDKLRMDLIPPEVIEEIGKVLTYGAKKYGDNNWQNVEAYRYKAALMRHYINWCKGEECDDESGLKHLSHMLTNVAFLLWKEIHDKGKKDGCCGQKDASGTCKGTCKGK